MKKSGAQAGAEVAQVGPASEAERLRLAGNEAFQAGKLEEADGFYSQAAEQLTAAGESDASKLAATLGNRSLVRLKLGKPEDALADAEASVTADPLYLKAHDRKATAQLALGKHWAGRKSYGDALDVFADDIAARVYLKQKLAALKAACKQEDATLPVQDKEHWCELAKYAQSRMRLATMATLWNGADTQGERLAIFKAFLVVLTGGSVAEARLADFPEGALVALPMENYDDVVGDIPQTWVEFYKGKPIEEKIALFHIIYEACSDDEKSLIARDLKQMFPPQPPQPPPGPAP